MLRFERAVGISTFAQNGSRKREEERGLCDLSVHTFFAVTTFGVGTIFVAMKYVAARIMKNNPITA